MSKSELMALIQQLLNQAREARGLDSIPVAEETRLLDGDAGIDSLDLAAMVVELEISAGKDPFANGFVNFETCGELARLYSNQTE